MDGYPEFHHFGAHTVQRVISYSPFRRRAFTTRCLRVMRRLLDFGFIRAGDDAVVGDEVGREGGVVHLHHRPDPARDRLVVEVDEMVDGLGEAGVTEEGAVVVLALPGVAEHAFELSEESTLRRGIPALPRDDRSAGGTERVC